MKKGQLFGTVLKWLYRYFVFFLVAAFVVTCCMTLFVSTLTEALEIPLTDANMGRAAKLTLANVFLISLIFTTADGLRRRFFLRRPIKRISDAAERLMRGDFTARVPKGTSLLSDDSFDAIADSFNKLAQELGSVETLRCDFIANVSHEMKTPLAVIQNYGRLLQSEDLSESERVEYARGVTDGAGRMADMLTSILKLNRLENQQIYPNFTEFDLGEQLCECAIAFERVWEEKDIELECELDESVTVSADAELLCLVWNNLLSNAFKFTPNGGRVGLSMHSDGETVSVCVSDTGCGMSANVGAHIFEKFYQGDTSHASEGNGLGLALVKRVVDIMHGEISVESTVGHGSCFTVRIKLHP